MVLFIHYTLFSIQPVIIAIRGPMTRRKIIQNYFARVSEGHTRYSPSKKYT